jgi:perosamine synthetase
MSVNNIQMAEINLTEEEIAAAERILRSGQLRQGKECYAFEQEFAQKVGAEYAVCSANGTAALHLAFMAFLQPGEEVIVPSFTFIATASMVTMAGGKPIFCDIDIETFLIDLEDAEKKISARTRAIAPVHLFGNVCNIERVQAFAKKHDLVVVWDAAQAHGATFKGQDVGGFADFVCYSFYPSKNMFVGEGGMTCSDSEQYEYQMRFLRTHGQTGKYVHTMLGLNYRMTDVEAAIGRKQLERLDDMLVLRRRNAAILNDGLKDFPGLKVQKITSGNEHAWHQYCVVVDEKNSGLTRDQLAQALKMKGIATGIHYPSGLHQQPIFRELYGDCQLPNTEYLAEHILALPVHHGLTVENVHWIIDAVWSSRESKMKGNISS